MDTNPGSGDHRTNHGRQCERFLRTRRRRRARLGGYRREQVKMRTGWEHFTHMADIGVRGRGANAAQAFEQAALALTAVVTDPEDVTTVEKVRITCRAPDLELLLAEFLNAVVYEMAVRRMLFGFFRVQLDSDRGELSASLGGELVDRIRHQPAVEVKGATFTELQVRESEPGTWIAQCVVDV